MIEVELPDGKIVEFPDGTPPEEIRKQLAPFLKPPQPEGSATIGDAARGLERGGLSPASAAFLEKMRRENPGAEGNDFVKKEGLTNVLDRSTIVGAGGTIGALAGGALGAPGGPGGAARGGVIGGGLGAAAGSAIFDNVDQFLRANGFFGGTPESGLFGDPIQIGKRAINEGLTDLAFSLAFTGVGRIGKTVLPSVFRGGRSVVGRILGVANGEASALVAKAQDLGIPLSAFDVSGNAQSFARVLGVFPFIGTPIRKTEAARRGVIRETAEKLLNDIAPNTLMADLGGDLLKAATKSFKRFRKTAGVFYREYRDRAANASVKEIFDTKTVVEAVKSIEAEIREQLTKTATESTRRVHTLEGVAKETIKTAGLQAGKTAPAALRSLLSAWKNLPERLTIQQVRGLKQEARRVMSITPPKDNTTKKRLVDLIKSLDTTLQNPRTDLLPDGEAKALIESLEAANSFFSRNMPRFESATGKKFLLTDKRLFTVGPAQPGTRTADELAKVFGNPSPGRVKELRALVSPKVMKRYARSVLQNAYEAALTPGGEGGEAVFNATVFEAKLGLAGSDRLRKEGLEALLQGTEVGFGDLQRFIEVAKRAQAFSAPNASEFIKRRFVLGGAFSGGAITGAFFAGAGDTSLIAAAFLILGSRKMAKIISDPARLRNMTLLLDRTKPISARREAGKRIVRAIAAPEPFEFVGGS